MGPTRQLWIPGPAGKLEATLRVATAARAAAVLAHPHPRYGGTLHNSVVFHADRELNRAGLHTLRFNFRGVGSSDGTHDDGRGETEDLGAAAGWLRGICDDLPLLIVGYSFGSWCAVRFAASDDLAAGVIALGLPVRNYEFAELARLRRPFAVVQGQHDEFGSPAEIRPVLDSLDPPGEIWVMRGVTHLFPGQARQAADRVVQAADWVLGRLKP